MTPQDEEAILTSRVSILEGELTVTREQLELLKKDVNRKTE
jgi:hypothetical protein